MYVADTIMMTSNTRTTSTMGVTLIPTIPPRFPRPELTAAPMASPFPVGGELARLMGMGRRAKRAQMPLAGRSASGTFVLVQELLLPVACLDERRNQFGERQRARFDIANLLLHDVVSDDRRQRHE